MAARIVQPKVLASQNPDTYDDLIMAQAQNATNVTTNINGKAITDIFESNGTTVKNATNAILNSDGSYSGFTQSANNVLSVGNEIVAKKILMWQGNASPTSESPLDISSLNFQSGDLVEIKIKWSVSYYDTTFITMEYPSSGNYNDKNVCAIQIQQSPAALLVHQGFVSIYDEQKKIQFDFMRYATVTNGSVTYVPETTLPIITAIYKIIQ